MASLEEQRGVAPAQLPDQQLRFITYGSSKHAQWEGDWLASESRSANAHRPSEAGALASPGAPANLISASIAVVQAPACYTLPVTQKKAFKAPFKIRLRLAYTGKLQVPVKVEAIALPESSVEHLAKQQGATALVPTQLTQQNELENASISCCIQTHDIEDDGSSEKQHYEDLEFTELRFSKSSRMNRRWVLFSCRLGWDMLYTLYRLPTIVLSRKMDQFEKACGLLLQKNVIANVAGGVQQQNPTAAGTPLDGDNEFSAQHLCQGTAETGTGQPACGRLGSRSTVRLVHRSTIRQFIHDKYVDSGLRRPLTEADLKALELKAGVQDVGTACATDCFKWREFRTWLNACLSSLRVVEHLWNITDLIRICSFSVDRAYSERLLRDQPHGTFVVRTCSLPGAFAISTKVEVCGLTPEVNHVLIDALDLKDQPLEKWITDNDMALNLLDTQSGKHTPKWIAFQAQNLAPVNSPSELSSPLCVAGPLLSPSPLSSITTIDAGTPTFSIDRAPSEETQLPHGLMLSMLSHQRTQNQLHLRGRQQHQQLLQQQHQQPPLAHRVVPLDQENLRDLRCLVDAGGMAPGRGSTEGLREQILGKRSSSTSVGTTFLLGERPYKRRLLGLQDGELFSMQRTLGGVGHVEHCNV